MPTNPYPSGLKLPLRSTRSSKRPKARPISTSTAGFGHLPVRPHLFSLLYYPSDYGWICGTKEEGRKQAAEHPGDGSNPTFVGCIVAARPVGTLLMHDHRGEDDKTSPSPSPTRASMT